MGFLAGLFTGGQADWSVIVLTLIVLAGVAMLAGSSYTISLSFSLPVALVLYNAISDTAFLASISTRFASSLEQAIAFVIIEVVLFACAQRVLSLFSHSAGPLAGLVAGAAASAVLFVVWLQVPALQSLWYFGPQVQSLFGPHYRFWWLIGAYLLLAFAGS